MVSNREAKIIKIKERKKTNFVGVTKSITNRLFVSTTGKKDKIDFLITEPKKNKRQSVSCGRFFKLGQRASRS